MAGVAAHSRSLLNTMSPSRFRVRCFFILFNREPFRGSDLIKWRLSGGIEHNCSSASVTRSRTLSLPERSPRNPWSKLTSWKSILSQPEPPAPQTTTSDPSNSSSLT